MPVRYETLRSGRWVSLSDAARGWQNIADDLAKQVGEFDRKVVVPINGKSWHGKGADAAKAKVQQTMDRMTATQKYLDADAQLMQAAYDGIWTAWQRSTDSWATPPSDVAIDDDGRVSFNSAPDTFNWYEPPIRSMMRSQALVYQALHMADVVNRKIAPLMWYPPNRSPDDIGPVAGADTNLHLARQTCQDVQAELKQVSVDEQPSTDTAPQPRGDLGPPTEYDKGVAILLHMAVDYLSVSGRPHGSDFLDHWLGGSGKTKYVDPNEMRRDIPKFDHAVQGAVASAPGEGCFDTGWTNTDVQDGGVTQSEDWWYAMNDFRYRVTGRAVIVDGERSVDYTVGVVKPYVFGPPRNPIKIPYLGIELEQSEIERLHHVGYAQNFIIQGLAHGTA